jgi:hypothetical protein
VRMTAMTAAALVDMIAGSEAPDQYLPDKVLPRFALMNAGGDGSYGTPSDSVQNAAGSAASTANFQVSDLLSSAKTLHHLQVRDGEDEL